MGRPSPGKKATKKLTMRRFFIHPDNIRNSIATLSGPEAHHLARVLRMKPGMPVSLFDGTGNSYEGIIESITEQSAVIIIHEQKKITRSGTAVHFAQALLSGKKMDLVVQKATELGIDSLHPFVSKYCTGKLEKDKISRWERISLESCKQSGRAIPMKIHPPVEFSSIINSGCNFDSKLIFWEKEKNHGPDIIAGGSTGRLICIIGAEGGFADEEVSLALNKGFNPVTLGSLTLRAETAAISAMAIIQFLVGNLSRMP